MSSKFAMGKFGPRLGVANGYIDLCGSYVFLLASARPAIYSQKMSNLVL